MKSIKAIITGCLFILVVLFLFGLIYIFAAVGYNSLTADFPFLNEIRDVFRYLLGIPVFIITMFAGGYVTANIADMHTAIKVWLHCFTVGLITVGSMMYSATEYSSLNLTGIIVTILALAASSAGGFYWLKGNK